jgi:hypothetical protein
LDSVHTPVKLSEVADGVVFNLPKSGASDDCFNCIGFKQADERLARGCNARGQVTESIVGGRRGSSRRLRIIENDFRSSREFTDGSQDRLD